MREKRASVSNRIKKSNSIARIEFNRTELTCVRLTISSSHGSTFLGVCQGLHPPGMKNSIMLTLGAAVARGSAKAMKDAR